MAQGIEKNQFQCWVCRQASSKNNGISLDEPEIIHVCHPCWNRIPNHWRLVTKKWFMDNPGNPDLAKLMLRSSAN